MMEDFSQNRRAARSCTSVKPENTFATATDSSALYRSAPIGENEEKVIEEDAGRKTLSRERE